MTMPTPPQKKVPMLSDLLQVIDQAGRLLDCATGALLSFSLS